MKKCLKSGKSVPEELSLGEGGELGFEEMFEIARVGGEDTVEASEPRALECEGSILADEDFTEPFIQVGCDSIEKGREHSKDWPNG